MKVNIRMKKNTKTKRIVTALVVVLTTFIFFNLTYKVWIAIRLESIAKVLLNDLQSEDIVHLGSSTKSKLEELPKDVKINVRIGDATAPIGDRKADACIFYSTKQKKLLGLRMKYDIRRNKFHIMGYWTP